MITSSVPALAEFKKGLYDLGYNLQFSYFADTLANPTGGVQQGAAYEGLLYMVLDVDLAKIAGLNGLSFRVNAYQIHGRQLSAYNIFNFATVDSIEARPATRLFELWVEQKLGDLAAVEPRDLKRWAGSLRRKVDTCIYVPSADIHGAAVFYRWSG